MVSSWRGSVLVAAALAAFSLGGCSLIFLHPDERDYDANGIPQCTRSWDGVVLDGIFTAASGAAAHYLWSTDNSTRKLEAIGFGVGSALWLSSAIYALYDAIQCDELRAEYAPATRPSRSRGHAPPVQ